MVIGIMPILNTSVEQYSSRLLANLQEMPYAVFEHLLSSNSVLRPKQREASEVTAQMILEEQLRAIALIMPTSTGKTVILAQLIAALHQDEKIGHSPKKVIIVTDTKEGILQTEEKLRLYAGIECGLYYGDRKNLAPSVVATTYNSWQDQDFPINPEDVDIVILDEAHEAISDARLIKLKQYKNAIWLALTASPTYSQERSVLQYFALGYRMSMEEAVEHSLVSSFRNIVLNSNINVDLSNIRSRGKDFDKRLLEKVVNTEARNQVGAEYLLFGRHFDTGRPIRNIRGIVSCVGTRHAESFARQTNALYDYYYPGRAPEGGFIRFVSGTTTDRREVLDWHRSDRIQYLAYADLLNQNYDDHGIGVVLNLRPTQSWVLATQRGGRPGRLDELNPGKIALIVDVHDQYQGKSKQQPLFYSFAIGASAIITEQAKFLAQKEFTTQKYDTIDRSLIPETEDIIKRIELNIVTDEESIFSLFSPEEERRQKTEEDLSLTEIAKLCDVSETLITSGLKRLLEDWRLHRSDPEKYTEPNTPVEVVNTNRGFATNRPTLTINCKNFESFKSKYLPSLSLRLKTDDDLIITDLVTLTGLGEKRITTALGKLRRQWQQYENNQAKEKKPSIETDTVRIRSGNAAFSIQRKNLNLFIEEYLQDGYLREKTNDDLSITEIAKETGFGETTIRRKIDILLEAWNAYKDDPKASPKPPVSVNKVKHKQRYTVYTIPKSEFSIFQEEILLKIASKEDYYFADDIARMTGLKLHIIKNSLVKIKKAQKAHDSDPTKNAKPLVFVEQVKPEDASKALGIKQSEFELYKNTYLKHALGNILIRTKTNQDLTLMDLMKVTGCNETTVLTALNRIKVEWKQYEEAPQKNKTPALRLSTVLKAGRPATSVMLADLLNFIEYLPDTFEKNSAEIANYIDQQLKSGTSPKPI
jgi:superfamily II DNA or RNA helicase/predicted DNA-binding protein YlxM (UPF0122 family)